MPLSGWQNFQSPEFVGVRMDAAHGPIVGREVEIAYLHQCLDKVWRGTRQIVFVTGEAGLGKTTVVEAFVTEAERRGDAVDWAWAVCRTLRGW